MPAETTAKTRKKTRPRKEPEPSTERNAITEESDDGAKVMLDRANDALLTDSRLIVNAFREQAKQGNAVSAKFLFELASKRKRSSKSGQKLLQNLIESLNEPEPQSKPAAAETNR